VQRARESSTYNAYREAATVLGARLFRNNVGVFMDRRGNKIRVGLYPGSADLIGWRTITITPEMVGTQIAQFLSVEVKIRGGHTDTKTGTRQECWREAVTRAGGAGLRCYTVAEMNAALRGAQEQTEGVA